MSKKNDGFFHIFDQIKVLRVNQTLPSLHGGSLEITLTIPLKRKFKIIFVEKVSCLGPVSLQAEGGCERQGVEGRQVPRHARHVRYV